MNESQDGVRNGLSVGVLIIGSLYWDLASDRKEWRASRLNAGGARTVRAPIRYGRRVLPSSSVGEESLSPNHPDTSSRF